ncbi:MAG: glucose 1-dehydrogenase [Bacteroidota bacterium]|nr:glucose 1-dehydrogenase [Bacteroidota bacterium]
METGIKGKTAVVTGAGSGIGRATALAFAAAGAKVVVAEKDEASGKTTMQMIQAQGGEAMFIMTDVAKAGDVELMLAMAEQRFGTVDFAFNNAGVEGISSPTHECSASNWDQTMAVDLRGTWICMKSEIATMLRHTGGVVVNCSSIAGLVGFEGMPAYVAAKHGVAGLTKTAALEYAQKNIRVNAVCPGVIHTAMVDRVAGNDPAALASFAAMAPMGRMGKPEEIASVVLWLCSDQAGYVTGAVIPVDGGYMAR